MKSFVEIQGAAMVITGAGSGIGRGCAQAFANRGARVVVTDVLEDRVDAVVREIREAGGEAIGLVCNVTQDADIERTRDACLEHFGRVDIVMNNVGVLAMGAPENLPLEAWQRVLDINLLGIVRSNRVFLPLLIDQGSGHVINTASLSGLLAHGYDRLPYVTSKHAVVGMSEGLALYLRPRGVGMTCLCPAAVRTNIVEQITFYDQPGTPRAPDYRAVDSEEVGELVVAAVRDGRFLVLTDPAIQDELIERVANIETYIDKHQGD
jgi:NAD(P)-dependent dehydrogenase (short-subunit alcohol dehydrogenase family)